MLPGFTTTQVNGKMLVTGILPNSPAVAAGLRLGDRLLRVDEHDAPLCADAAAVWQSGRTLRIEIERNGEKLLVLLLPERKEAVLLASLQQPLNVSNSRLLLPTSPYFSGMSVMVRRGKMFVSGILPGSNADISGIAAGDELITISDSTSIVNGSDHRVVLDLRVRHGGVVRSMKIRMTSFSEWLDRLENAPQGAPSAVTTSTAM
ncbi:MAG TPA: PDZ domain-containing protein [Candidatus Angelobacter sp.]